MLQRRYLAFDLEIAEVLPPETRDLMAHRPLGISCAATLADGDERARSWYSRRPDGSPAARMSRTDLAQLVNFLTDQVAEGYTIASWNGLGFDFDILAEESGAMEACIQLALAHVDMMFHVFCLKGFAVSLESATQGIGAQGKFDGMQAAEAPQLWADGEFERVLAYVERDCASTYEVAVTNERQGFFAWVTRRGTRSSFDLPGGWLAVSEAMRLPEPDTSWMSTPPWPRAKFTAWLGSSG